MMDFINKIFGRKTGETEKTEKRNANNMNAIFAHTNFDSGIGQDATSWAAIDMIASSMANLAGNFYNRRTRQALPGNHTLHDLLEHPNADETRFQFMYSSVADYFNHGNVYWYKYTNEDGIITSLFRIDPTKITLKRNGMNQKVFTYNSNEYKSDKIVHIPSRYGYDGLKGKSIFSECGNIFRLSNELDDFVNNSFTNNVGNRLIIDITKFIDDAKKEDIKQIKTDFLQNYTGVKNAGKPLIKHNGLEYSNIETKTPTNQASQLMENRQHQEKEIAKLFGIPLSLLNGSETSNVESIYTLYIESAIRPLATQFEQAINRLIFSHQRSRLYFEYSYNSLMKTSLNDRIAAYTRQMQIGILSINEIRAKENLPPIEGGDIHWLPANMMPLKDDIIESYMAGAKLKQYELEAKLNESMPGMPGDHLPMGDDKS